MGNLTKLGGFICRDTQTIHVLRHIYLHEWKKQHPIWNVFGQLRVTWAFLGYLPSDITWGKYITHKGKPHETWNGCHLWWFKTNQSSVETGNNHQVFWTRMPNLKHNMHTKYRRIPRNTCNVFRKNNNLVEFHILPGHCTDIFHPVTLISSKQQQQQLFTQTSRFFIRRYNWMPCYNLNATSILLVLGNDEASHIPNLIGKGLAWFGACDATSRTALGNPENARGFPSSEGGHPVSYKKKTPNFPLNPGWNCRDPYIGWLKNPHRNWV